MKWVVHYWRWCTSRYYRIAYSMALATKRAYPEYFTKDKQ